MQMIDSPPPVTRKRRNRLTRDRRNEAVVRTCDLLRDSHSDGQVKRIIANEFQLRPRSVDRFLTVARRRISGGLNNQSVGNIEHVASSYSFWSRKLQESEAAIRAQLQKSRGAWMAIAEANQALQSGLGDRSEIVDRLNAAHESIEMSRRRISQEQNLAIQYRDRIDKLLGVHAPVRIAAGKA